MNTGILTWKRPALRGLLFATLFFTTVGITAQAQPGREGGASPELRAKISAAQAQSVASALKLEGEQSEKLVAAFAAFQQSAAENRPERGARGDWEAMRKQQEDRKSSLQTELNGFLSEEVAQQAAQTLGGFNRGWDRLVQVILEFGLEDAKQTEALGYILAHVQASSKAMEAQGESRDFEALRGTMEAAKKELDAKVNPLLSEGQQAEWKSKTERGAGRRGGSPEGGDRSNRKERESEN